MKWRRKLQYFYLRFIRLRGSHAQIARGFAFGVFWGMFPLPGLQMVIAILTAALFRSSKLAAAAGTWLTNPITTLPFTALNFYVGQKVLGREWNDLPVSHLHSINHLLYLGVEVVAVYILGCAVTGAIAGVVSYCVGLPLIAYLRERALRHKRKRHWI